MVQNTHIDDQEVQTPQVTSDSADLDQAEIGELVGLVASAVNRLDGAGLEIQDGEVRVDSSVFDGSIEGISNPLTDDVDGAGYNIQNVGTGGFEALEAAESSVDNIGLHAELSEEDQNIMADTETKITFDSAITDHFGAFDPDSHEFTAPADGWFLIHSNVRTHSSADDRNRIEIHINGSAVTYSRDVIANSENVHGLSITSMISLSSEDVVDIRYKNFESDDIISSSSRESYFMVTKL